VAKSASEIMEMFLERRLTMMDFTTMLLGVLIGIGLIIFGVSRFDKRSGCFYALLMMIDALAAGAVLLGRYS